MRESVDRVRLLAIIAAVVIAALMASPGWAAQTKPKKVPQTVKVLLEAHIKQYVAQFQPEDPDDEQRICGEEYKEARRYCFGDINKDGKEDIAVLYVVEGLGCGNNAQFHLAVFLKKGARFQLVASEEVGGKGERNVEFKEIKAGKILLNTEELLPGDPFCCPSGKSSTTYSLKKGKLVESKPLLVSLADYYHRTSLRISKWIGGVFGTKEQQ